ncbi:Elongation factor 1-alpha [Euphorbia peplus]|nr:Elongation factor 1-alpha [Euphorbia peplus]
MPRKINHGVDYYEDYDDDDYEDYDNYEDLEEHEEAPEAKQAISTSRLGKWSCPICTYDNDEGMSACDICGVIRNPTAGNYKNNDRKAADSMCKCKDSGVSVMAKSLFGSLPHCPPQKPVVAQLQKDDFKVAQGGFDFLKCENSRGNLYEFLKAYSFPNRSAHSKINIDSFKFDVPSPDDVVVKGLHSFKKGAKANSLNIKSTSASSGMNEKTGATNARSTVKKLDNDPSLVAKGKQGNQDEITYTRNGVAVVKSDFGSSDSSSSSMPKEKHKSIDDASSSSIEGGFHKLTSELNTISMSDKSRNSSNLNDRKAKPRAQYQPEKWMLPVEADESVTQLNLAIVGHVDSGKSTLTGRLLHLRGRITQKQMHKFEKEAKLQGKGSFAYAWALDESSEERERGITMTVAVAYFDSKKYHVVVLDSPGHKDFVPNMISGATQADAAILVIDASLGAFEAGMDSKKGQTREHAQLIRSFGVDQIIVAINKMDAVGYSNDRFDFIRSELAAFLRPCGFKDSSVTWIPLSVMENQNLVSAPSDARLLSWYNGPCLLDAIDSFQPPSRDYSKPLLMPICDVTKLTSGGQVSACGKLEAGAIRTGSKVLVMPSGDIGTVRTLERDSQACSVARAGDNVAVGLAGIDGSILMAGGVLCHPDFPVAVAKHLELKVLILDFATPILAGSQLEFHLYHAKEAARVSRIVSLLDPKTGKVTKKAPRCLIPKQQAIIEVVLNGPICVEQFSNCKALGRVALRQMGRTIALGVVTRIIEDPE